MADDELRIRALAMADVPVLSYSHKHRSISIYNYGELAAPSWQAGMERERPALGLLRP